MIKEEKIGILSGLTKREHFASLFLQAHISNLNYEQLQALHDLSDEEGIAVEVILARKSISYADALIYTMKE